jgi:formylglycine-generating enzyme required for sulfatase activity
MGVVAIPDMVHIARGTFRMGSERHYPEEAPAHTATVDEFWIYEPRVPQIRARPAM